MRISKDDLVDIATGAAFLGPGVAGIRISAGCWR